MFIQKIEKLFVKYKTFILYACFGIPSTILSFGVYSLFAYFLPFPAFVSNAFSWVVGVLVSFWLYRKFVFHSDKMTFKEIAVEFCEFVALRIVSGLLETGLVFLFVDTLHLHKFFFKVLASLTAALLNFAISKIFVFAKKK